MSNENFAEKGAAVVEVNLTQDVSKSISRSGAKNGFVSFREYYGVVLADIDPECLDYIDESVYFKALVKLDVLNKAKITIDKENGIPIYEDDKDGTYLPKNTLVAVTLYENSKESDDEYEELSYFMTKRGGFGFNTNSKDLQVLVKEPLLKLLCDFNTDALKAREQFEAQKQVLKQNKLPVGNLSWQDTLNKVRQKYFG